MPTTFKIPISPAADAPTSDGAAVDLYWLPLGAGGRSVRFNGLVFEAIAARLQHRTRSDLYHSALEVRVGSDRYVIEMAPVWNDHASDRGVVSESAVASRRLGWLRLFRYEIRRWRDGRIPDVAEAVGSPQRLTEDAAVAQRVLDLVPSVPTLVWGRDELHTGDMWNSNSVIAWLLVEAGIDLALVDLPAGGSAPGWTAGIAATRPAAVSARAAEGPAVRAMYAVMPGRSATSRRSPRPGRGVDRTGRGRSAPWRAAECRASIRRA
jgi:hypothetical protein